MRFTFERWLSSLSCSVVLTWLLKSGSKIKFKFRRYQICIVLDVLLGCEDDEKKKKKYNELWFEINKIWNGRKKMPYFYLLVFHSDVRNKVFYGFISNLFVGISLLRSNCSNILIVQKAIENLMQYKADKFFVYFKLS